MGAPTFGRPVGQAGPSGGQRGEERRGKARQANGANLADEFIGRPPLKSIEQICLQ